MKGSWRARPEVGALWIVRSYVWCVRMIGRPFARFTLAPISLYFLLVRGPERRASKAFLERALARRPTLRDVYRHFRTFAQVLLDRVYLLGEREPPLDVRIADIEVLRDALARGQGCLLVGSHLGSFEAGRVISRQRPDVRLRIVMDRSVSPNATRMLEVLNPELACQVIDTTERRGTLALQLGEALAAGDLVAMLGDRVVDEERSAAVNFLGARAALPLAPFLMATVTHAPVVLFFGIYEGGRRYRVVFEPFNVVHAERGQRQQALEAMVQEYADRLAHHARSAPYNWFNFFPYWGEESA